MSFFSKGWNAFKKFTPTGFTIDTMFGNDGVDDAKTKAEAAEGQYNNSREARLRTAAGIRAGGYDQGMADNYYNQQNEGIEQAFSAASGSAAADYARRGLSNSGAAGGAQLQAALNRASQQRLAKADAISKASQDTYRNKMGAAGVEGDVFSADAGRLQQLEAAYREAQARGDEKQMAVLSMFLAPFQFGMGGSQAVGGYSLPQPSGGAAAPAPRGGFGFRGFGGG